MITRRACRARMATGGAVAGVALLLAACGSSSPGQATNSASTKPGAAKPAVLTVTTAKGSKGTYLVGASGRALYMWMADHNGKSACSGSCAQNWPPLIASAAPKAAGGVNAGDFGTTVRSDGSKQVTYKGHPLYYFIEDSGPGMTSGEGSDAFGARWWLVSPAGVALTGKSSSSSSSGYGGSSSGGW